MTVAEIMHPLRFTLTVITGMLVLILLAKVLDWLLKRRSLGVVLWTNSTGHRWVAMALMFIGSLDVADGIYSRDYRRLTTGSLFVSIGFSLIFPLGRLRVYEKGIEVGLLVLPWSQISGWEWDGGPRDRKLYLRTRSRWRLFYDPRPARPVRTTVPFDDRLNHLLEEHLTCH